jgi:outer membrane cobalamin receptor
VDDIDDVTAWSPRVGAVAKWRHASMYVSAGRGFNAPTLEQLYDVRPRITLSNPGLEPQRARSLEAGARGGRWADDAYLIRVTNEIDFDPSTFRYGNIARSEHRGLEALWDGRPLRLTYACSRSMTPRARS